MIYKGMLETDVEDGSGFSRCLRVPGLIIMREA